MKKLLLNLLAIVSITLMFGGSACGQNKVWRMSDWSDLTIPTSGSITVDGLTFYGGSSSSYVTGGEITFDDGQTFAGSIKLGGKSTIKSNADLARVFTFNVTGTCTVKVYAGSTTTSARTAIMSQTLTTTSLDQSTYIATNNVTKNCTTFLTGTATEGIVYISADADIRIYAITVTYPSSDFVLTTEDTDYYTLYLDYDATIPEGVTVYTGALNADESQVNVTPITGNVLPANTGVLVKTEAAGDYTFAKTDETADEITGNVLKGVVEETSVEDVAETGKIVLTLGTLDGVLGFRKPQSGKLEANKAYLYVSETASQKMSVIGIGTGEGTTGITGISTDTENNGTTTYNIAGQRVSSNAKGLLIRNGKKIIRK